MPAYSARSVTRIWRGRLSLWIRITGCTVQRIITGEMDNHHHTSAQVYSPGYMASCALLARSQLYQRKDKPKHQELEL